LLGVKYFCDICGVELKTPIERIELTIHTSHPRDLNFYLCIKCIDKSVIDLVAELLTKPKSRLGQRESPMYLTIEGSSIFKRE